MHICNICLDRQILFYIIVYNLLFQHMLVYSKESGVEVPPHSFEVIYVPINKNRLHQGYIRNRGLEYAYQDYRMGFKYKNVGIYYGNTNLILKVKLSSKYVY